MNYERSTRYLNAFSDIEKILRRLAGEDKHVPFGQLVKKSEKIEKSVRTYADDLIEFADLRNAIVHKRSDGVHPIAEPHLNTVVYIKLKVPQIIIEKYPTLKYTSTCY